MPEDNSAYKGIYGIGSHFNNDYQISGATVSRYHATVKHGKDGKFYIVDHSKNGTTVDGTKIAPNTPYRIKKSSAVVCGGVPVDLSRLPWPADIWKYVAGIAATIALIITIGLTNPFDGRWFNGLFDRNLTLEEVNDRYNSSVVMLVGLYHYEVTAGKLPKETIHKLGLATDFIVADGEIINKDRAGDKSCTYTGTGFFVSDDGKIVTNLHIVKPWLFDGTIGDFEDYYRKEFAKLVEQRATILTTLGYTPEGLSAYISQIKVEGVSDGIMLIPQGKMFSSENAIKCTLLSAGDDINKDVALIQSDKMELPNKKATFINIADSMDITEEALKVGKTMYTIGFPTGLLSQMQDKKLTNGIQALCHTGHISQKSGEYGFKFDAVSAGGASGSPIFSEEGMLIGVLDAGINNVNINHGIKAEYVKELLDSPYKNK